MKKPILLDGAVGTSLWAIAEANGVKKVPVWRYNIEHPEYITQLTKAYAEAGSEYLLCNTFGANRLAVARSSSYTAPQVVRAGVELTKKALEGTGKKTVLSAGPLSVLIEPYGDMEEDECREIYDEMLSAGVEAGADAIMLQTFIDLEMLRIATESAKQFGLPIFCALSFEERGKTIMGDSVQKMIDTLGPLGVDAVGMNCSLGPDTSLPIIREFAEKTDIPLMFKPNAGMPITLGNGKTGVPCTPETFADAIAPALPYLTYVGGCCGTDPEYVKEIKKRIEAM